MLVLISCVASCVAAVAAVIGIIYAVYESKNNKQVKKIQLDAQNYNIRLVYEMLKELKKTPSEKKAEEFARKGGFSSYAKYLSKQDIGEMREFKLEDESK